MTSDIAWIDPTLLFDFEIPLFYWKTKWATTRKPLPDKYRLPHFAAMHQNETIATVWGAWSESGLYFDLEVPLPEASLNTRDELWHPTVWQVWIDTRHDPGNRRGTQNCHFFVFAPQEKARSPQPLATMRYMHRALALPNAIASEDLATTVIEMKVGFRMLVSIRASALTGFSPSEMRHLGFMYQLSVSNSDSQHLSVSPEVRFFEDPGHWCRLNLLD
ncbi:MAG: hypothetical protein U0905_03715 [Pirellulales bacterium]